VLDRPEGGGERRVPPAGLGGAAGRDGSYRSGGVQGFQSRVGGDRVGGLESFADGGVAGTSRRPKRRGAYRKVHPFEWIRDTFLTSGMLYMWLQDMGDRSVPDAASH
jgi:hypothetical protein